MDHFTRDGLVFDLSEAGPAGGEAVVLLHGFPQDRAAWDQVTPALHGAGLRTLAPDQRGYSPDARPRGRSAYRISECALDVVALLDQAGVEGAHVVGHDWGGTVAWALAIQHPGRVRTLTALSTPHPAALAWSFAHSTQGLKSWYMAFLQLPRLPELLVPRTLAGSLERSGLPPEITRRYAERMAEPGALTAALNWYRAMPASIRGGEGADDSVHVSLPTTYVWGRADFALGRAAASKTADFVTGDYRFVEVDGGHWLPETRASVVVDAVLARIDPH